jgi:hypothetical protein
MGDGSCAAVGVGAMRDVCLCVYAGILPRVEVLREQSKCLWFVIKRCRGSVLFIYIDALIAMMMMMMMMMMMVMMMVMMMMMTIC